MFAGHKKLANLTAIIDRNGLQIDGPVADICDVGDLAQKFAAFGWQTLDVDGHDVCALTRAFAKAAAADRTGPLAIVAHTVKGKGVSFMEDQCGWHGKAPGAEQCDAALAEIDAQLAEASDGEQMGETGGGAQGRHGSSGGRDFFGREAACG
jgi:transketolase